MKKLIVLLLCIMLLPAISYANDQSSYIVGSNYRIENQGNKPWCLAYAICNAIETKRIQMGLDVPEDGFSKAWLYQEYKSYNKEDKFIRSTMDIALEIVKTKGLCPTEYYNKKNAEKVASEYKISNYTAISYDIEDVKSVLANNNIIIISTEYGRLGWRNGTILESSGTDLHATYLVGYDNEKTIDGFTGFFKGVNSHGRHWGDNGMYNMAYDYFKFPNIRLLYTFTIEEMEDIYRL